MKPVTYFLMMLIAVPLGTYIGKMADGKVNELSTRPHRELEAKNDRELAAFTAELQRETDAANAADQMRLAEVRAWAAQFDHDANEFAADQQRRHETEVLDRYVRAVEALAD